MKRVAVARVPTKSRHEACPYPVPRRLQGWAVVAEQRFAEEFEWNYSLAHESVVKVLQSETTILFLSEIIAQLQDLQLAESVDEVSRITASTL